MLQFLLPFLILLLTAPALLLQHWLYPGDRRLWLLALAGSLLALAGILWWQRGLPMGAAATSNLLFTDWQPRLRLDALGWPQAFALTIALTGSLLTSLSQPVFPAPRRWAGLFALVLLGYLVVSAADLLTLAFLWTLLDLAEAAVLILAGQHPRYNEKAVISLSARLFSVGLLLWSNLLQSNRFSADLWLLLAAALRLGVLPFHLPLENSATQRQDVGAMLRIVAALSGFVIFRQVNFQAPAPFILIALLLTAFYSALRWLQANDVLDGRPYWVISLAAQAGALSLLGNKTGVTALSLMLTLGTMLFSLYALRKLRYSRLLLAISGLAFSSLPWTLTAAIWQFPSSPPAYFWALSLPAYALLLIGYTRHLLRPSILSLDHQPPPIRRLYLGGTGLLALTALGLGFFGWPGAGTTGQLIASLPVASLSLGGGWVIWRWRLLARLGKARFSARRSAGRIFPLLWRLYRAPGRQVNHLVTRYIEAPGGLLWVWLMALLIFTYWINK